MRRIAIVALACLAAEALPHLAVPRPFLQPDAQQLLGQWQVVSMQRSGMPDTAQVGGWLTFGSHHIVTSQPNVAYIADGTG